jgi:hypothetical protein
MEMRAARQCPTCGYEYQPWIEACPDCGSELIDKVAPEAEEHGPALARDEDPEWTFVTNVPNAIMGSFVKSQLEDAGIPVLMNRSRSADVGEFSHNDYVPHDLRVPKKMWGDARAIIDARSDGLFGAEPSAPTGSNIPEGWHMLPGTREEADAERAGWSLYRVPLDDEQSKSCVDPGGKFDPRPRQSDADLDEVFDEADYINEPVASAEWVRWFYGILLLAISLPFLLQLFAQLARIFEP